MSTTVTTTPTRKFTARALDAELGRRRNNRKRDVKARAKSFVLPALSTENIKAIKAGEVVEVTFASGRVEHVGLA